MRRVRVLNKVLEEELSSAYEKVKRGIDDFVLKMRVFLDNLGDMELELWKLEDMFGLLKKDGDEEAVKRLKRSLDRVSFDLDRVFRSCKELEESLSDLVLDLKDVVEFSDEE